MLIRTKANESGILPTSSVLTEYSRPFNIAAEQRYGHVVNGQILGPEGKPLRGGLIAGVSYLRETRNGVSYNVKLRAVTGYPAARQSWTGRNGPWVCWHAVYAYLTALYAEFPAARVDSMFITYNGIEDFEANAAKTFYHRSHPGAPYFGTLCHNLGWHDWHDAPDRRLADGTDLMSL